MGIEPTTPSLPRTCSTSEPQRQRYTMPTLSCRPLSFEMFATREHLGVGREGFEPSKVTQRIYSPPRLTTPASPRRILHHPFPPTAAPAAARVHKSLIVRYLRGMMPEAKEPAVGIEPTTCGLQNRCSATELRWRTNVPKRGGMLRRPSGQSRSGRDICGSRLTTPNRRLRNCFDSSPAPPEQKTRDPCQVDSSGRTQLTSS